LAALRSANEVWAGIMLMMALAAVGVAALGAICLRDKRRYWWIGFAVFESGYLMLALGPWCEVKIQPKLVTTLLLRYVHEQTVEPTPSLAQYYTILQQPNNRVRSITVETVKPQNTTYVRIKPALASPPRSRWRALLPGATSYDHFLLVGHIMFAFMTGLIGGAVARWFHATRVRDETPVAFSGVD
jgi:hypothetical protein